MWVKPCNRNAEESFPVLSLKSREQKPPNPLLIQDKNVLRPRPKVDLTASGGVLTGARILSTYPLPPFYGYGSGTSQAAAHVTGARALKLQQKPLLSLSEIQVLLCQTARNLGYHQATQQGCGLIDAEKLLAAP
jgi:Subtilase family